MLVDYQKRRFFSALGAISQSGASSLGDPPFQSGKTLFRCIARFSASSRFSVRGKNPLSACSLTQKHLAGIILLIGSQLVSYQSVAAAVPTSQSPDPPITSRQFKSHAPESPQPTFGGASTEIRNTVIQPNRNQSC